MRSWPPNDYFLAKTVSRYSFATKMKVLAIEMEKLWPFQKNFMAILAIFFNNSISPERPLDRFFSNFFRTCLKGSSFT